jgi:hypothetical protein
MMRNGIVYRQEQLARATDVIVSGSWPTPSGSGFSNEGQIKKLVENCETREEALAMSGNRESVMRKLWPTPGAGDSVKARMNPAMEKRVTARLKGGKPKSKAGHLFQESLPEAVELEERKMWPTVRVSAANGPSQSEIDQGNPKCRLETEVIVRSSTKKSSSPAQKDGRTASGHPQLNPEFCEYLMGFPIGWTE